MGVQAAAQIAQFDIARAGLRLHEALACLLGVDVARAGVYLEASVQAGGVNVA